jgi:hypothetical protein
MDGGNSGPRLEESLLVPAAGGPVTAGLYPFTLILLCSHAQERRVIAGQQDVIIPAAWCGFFDTRWVNSSKGVRSKTFVVRRVIFQVSE